MSPLVVLVDDVRSFRDDRPALVARSSAAGVELLLGLRDQHVDELWLDHDLVGDDTIWPVVHLLEDASLVGVPYDLGMVWVHASRAVAAHQVIVSLRRAGYEVRRSSHARFWRHDRA